MKILIITQNEPFFLPRFLDAFISERRNDVVGIVILKPFNERIYKTAKRIYILFGYFGFLIQLLRFIFLKTMGIVGNFFRLRKSYSISNVAKKFNISLLKTENVNSQKFLDNLNEGLCPDLIISIAASQIFKKRLLDLPKMGCINIHSGPLPKYRGMLPTFWALYNGEKKTAITVHYMNKYLDDGEIIYQEYTEILKDDNVQSLIKRTKVLGVSILLKAVKMIEEGQVKIKPNKKEYATYFSFPTRKNVKDFEKKLKIRIRI